MKCSCHKNNCKRSRAVNALHDKPLQWRFILLQHLHRSWLFFRYFRQSLGLGWSRFLLRQTGGCCRGGEAATLSVVSQCSTLQHKRLVNNAEKNSLQKSKFIIQTTSRVYGATKRIGFDCSVAFPANTAFEISLGFKGREKINFVDQGGRN